MSFLSHKAHDVSRRILKLTLEWVLSFGRWQQFRGFILQANEPNRGLEEDLEILFG
jgi:hypothetical protein